MSPELVEGEFVFCSIENARYGDYADLAPFASIKENEGLTLVVEKTIADEAGLHYESVFRGITLQVHSSLEAVGLTAAVASRLAQEGISANMIAGYYHDHLFVPWESRQQALAELQELSHSH